MEDQLRVPGEQLFVIEEIPCSYNFGRRALAIPGIRATSCVSAPALGMDRGSANFAQQTGALRRLGTSGCA